MLSFAAVARRKIQRGRRSRREIRLVLMFLLFAIVVSITSSLVSFSAVVAPAQLAQIRTYHEPVQPVKEHIYSEDGEEGLGLLGGDGVEGDEGYIGASDRSSTVQSIVEQVHDEEGDEGLAPFNEEEGDDDDKGGVGYIEASDQSSMLTIEPEDDIKLDNVSGDADATDADADANSTGLLDLDESEHAAVDSMRRIQYNEDRGSGSKLDFIVAGFPKCGTTSLLYAFRRHNETVMPEKEVCSFNKGSPRGMKRMQRAIKEASTNDADADADAIGAAGSIKHGIKCPLSVWHTIGLQKLAQSMPNVKLVIGVRHPVWFFQSYYNYRITSMHDKKTVVEVPPAESLIGIEHHWKDVSTDIARFELGLMQLGKVELSGQELTHLTSKGRQMAEIPYQIFLYSIEQLDDTDEKRSAVFSNDMQRFLGLDEPISFTRENVNHFVGAKRHPETIDICEPRFDSLRSLLVEQGSITSTWILEQFVVHDDVLVGGSTQYFRDLLSTWGNDPCP